MVKKEISGIHWNFTTMLEDFDFVDDIAQQQWTIYSSRQQSWKTTQQMWDETKYKKCNVLKLNRKSKASLTVENSEAEEVDSFLYTLGPMLQRAVRAGLTPGRE